MEVKNHQKHISVTLATLLEQLNVEPILKSALEPMEISEALKKRVSWIKTSDLAVPEVTTEKMVLLHLLWLQHIGRIVVEDIDPQCGAIRVRISFDDVIKHKIMENSKC
ncbi:MAG: hypothetical protein PUH91_13385 [Prevotella sp.]|nr:hypothetical protein [Prevotella sp.]